MKPRQGIRAQPPPSRRDSQIVLARNHVVSCDGFLLLSWLRVVLSRLYGAGAPRSLQIFRAKSSLISVWRGTAEVLLAARFTKIEWLAPSLSSSHP